MKAAMYVPGDFEVVDVPLPEFKTKLWYSLFPQDKPTTMLIRVRNAAINPVDYKVPFPLFPFLRWFVSNGVAKDVSGTVLAVNLGNDGCALKVGDDIFGKISAISGGTLQEYAVVECKAIAVKPKDLPFDVASAFGVAAGTSYEAITKHGSVKGKRVLVIGGSGGTGSVGVRLAHILGAHVTTICSGSNAEFVKSLGADEIIDYKSPSWEKVLKESQPFDLIYDTVTSLEDQDYVPLAIQALAKDGHYVAINGQVLDWIHTFLEKITKHHFGASNYELLLPDFSSQHYEAMGQMATDPKNPLKIPIDTKYPSVTTENVHKGFEKLKSRRTRGKIVFDVAEI
eukprot:TRINITY_DN14677_c0_g1_i1.p1 TRINITY_DN14677_c0_g1~~TRINITY_DN14677_c0_g1_i1.p1  ORF type:complete len:394 (-),score=86.90 TRINITY_DN14677_c0_g1_i1:257-1279(-)